jgi:GT2 family glycosyltransferase
MRPAVPRLAIIIPAVRSVESLETTLVSVLENRPDDCEVLVTLNQPYDDPYDLSGEVRFINVESDSGFVACANAGIHDTRAPIVHVLGSGCEVSAGWADAALAAFRDYRVAAVSPLVFDSVERERLVASGLRYGAGGSRRLAGGRAAKLIEQGAMPAFGPCGWSSFYRVAALQAVGGGFPTSVGDTLADADLAWILRQAGCMATLAPQAHVYAPAELLRRERGFRAGLHRERMFWRNAPGVGWFASLVCHPWTLAVEAVSSLAGPAVVTQMLGRMWGAIEIASHLKHHAWLETLDENAVVLPVENENGRRIDRSHVAAAKLQRHAGRRSGV